ncbi:hypothetical protein V6Z11_A05G318200, partial [Gossypium hirsutum]
GIGPCSLFPVKFKSWIFFNLPIVLGIDPLNSLLEKSKYIALFRLPISTGTRPLILQASTLNSSSDLERFESEVGRTQFNGLDDRSKNLRYLQFSKDLKKLDS